MATKKRTRLAGRDAGNGQFIPVAEARRRKKTAVVERVPVGRRKTGKKKSGKKR